MTMHKNTAR